MFDQTSRYHGIETALLAAEDGRPIAYVRRRFLPRGSAQTLLVEVRVAQGERLDNIAARMLGDPEQFWRICDANDTLNPAELVSEPGRLLRVSVPEA